MILDAVIAAAVGFAVVAGILFVGFLTLVVYAVTRDALYARHNRRSAETAAMFEGLGIPVTVIPRVSRLEAIAAPIPRQQRRPINGSPQ